MYNEMHMYSFLACMPMRMEVYGLRSVAEIEPPEVRMSKALHAMQSYFAHLSATPVDQQVILDIFLSLSEFYRGNFTAMQTHLRMVRYLVNSLGGLDSVSQYIREVCCYTELCFALRTGEAPVFEMTWDPGPRLNNRILRLKSAEWPSETKGFGSGFENPLREGFFDGPTKKVIEELVVDIPALEFVRNDAGAPPVDSQWACVRSHALLHRLLSLHAISGQASSQEWKVHCIITALAMLLGYENLCVSPVRYSKCVRARLISALRLSNNSFSQHGSWGRHNDMLLWVMITGVRIARGSDDERWFMSRAVQGCRILGLQGYDQLYALVRNFLWVENYECPALMKLADHILIAKAQSLDIKDRNPLSTGPENIEYQICMPR